MNSLWFIAFLAMVVAYDLQRRKLRSAEKRTKVAEEREAHFGVMFAHIVKENPGLIQGYFDRLIEDDQEEEE